MKALGIIVNVLAILVAGGLGVMFRGKLKVRFQEIVVQVCGLAVILIGFMSAWDGFFVLQDGQTEVTGSLLVLFSLLVGTAFGEAFDLEKGLIKLGGVFRELTVKDEKKEAARILKKQQERAVKRAAAEAQGKKLRRSLDELPIYDLPTTRTGHLFTDGFVIASVMAALGALSVTGAIEAGMNGNNTPLFIKAAIDFVLLFALATVYGSGVTFAALPVLAVEGIVTIVAVYAGHLITPTLLGQLTLIGAVITMVAGIHLAFGKKLRAANMVPSFLIPVIYGIVLLIIQKVSGE